MKNDLNHLERLQSLTSNYELLQGYPIAMAGLLYILGGTCVMIWGGTALDLIYGWLFLPIMALLAIALKIAVRYHRRKFGLVKTPMGPSRGRAIIVFGGLYVILIGLSGPDFKHLKLALEPTVLNAGLMLVLMGLLPGFPWRHYVAVGLALAGIAFLPAFHIVTVQQFWHGWSFMAPGIAFLLCGAIDRLIFMRSLPSASAEEVHV